MAKKLKHKFLDAVVDGKLGIMTESGLVVTTKEFVAYLENESRPEYLRSYLPSVAIEPGRHMMQHNKYLFRLRQGVFRVHPDAITEHKRKHGY